MRRALQRITGWFKRRGPRGRTPVFPPKVADKQALLQKALSHAPELFAPELVLREGGAHPKRILQRTQLGSNYAYALAPKIVSPRRFFKSQHVRSLVGRVFDKRQRVFSQELTNKTVALLKEHGYLAEEPVWDKARPDRMVSYRAGHTLGELQRVFPKRFRRLATPETAERLADLIGLLWKNGLSHGHPHYGNIVYFKGRFGLIDWKLLATLELDFARAKPAEIVKGIGLDIIQFKRVLEKFAVSNPGGWPQPPRQREAIYRRMLEHLPVPAETREAVLQRVLEWDQGKGSL